MGIIAPTLPTIGDLNSIADPQTRAALSAILTLLNGNIDTANIAAGGVAASDVGANAVGLSNMTTAAKQNFMQLGTAGVTAHFGRATTAYGGGGSSVGQSVTYPTLVSGQPLFAAAIPQGKNANGNGHALVAPIAAANATAMNWEVFDIDFPTAATMGAGTYLTWWIVVG